MSNELSAPVLLYMKSQFLPLGFQVLEESDKGFAVRIFNQQSGTTILEARRNNSPHMMSQVEAHAWVASIKREIDKQFYVQRKKSLDKV
jgi:hypothetical protein